LSLRHIEEDTAGFSKIAEYLRREAGINLVLSPKNQTLLAGRMCKLLPQLGLTNYQELYAALVTGKPIIREQFISAVTTNTTHFFREMPHFQILSKVVRECVQSSDKMKSRELRIWCAACSSGEEPYSIGMAVKSSLSVLDNWTVRILATDIDNEVLQRATRGVYSANVLDSISREYADKYFERGKGQSSDFVRVRKSIRDMVTFAQFNLMTPSYPFQHKFDIIFCRNVMIYFDKPEIESTIKKLEASLRPGGYLFLGHSESIMGSSPTLKSRAAAVYEKIPAVRKGEAA